MTDTPHPWGRLPKETPKSYAAFLSYCDLGPKDLYVWRLVKTMSKQGHLGPKSRR